MCFHIEIQGASALKKREFFFILLCKKAESGFKVGFGLFGMTLAIQLYNIFNLIKVLSWGKMCMRIIIAYVI